MKKEDVSSGIMQTMDLDDGTAMYRVSCVCQTPEDDVSVTVEVREDDNPPFDGDVTVTFNTKLHIPIWRKGFCRFCTAMKILLTGEVEYESETIMSSQQALLFANVIINKVTALKDARKRPVTAKPVTVTAVSAAVATATLTEGTVKSNVKVVKASKNKTKPTGKPPKPASRKIK